MKLLLDTQAFLWFLLDDERLSTHAKTSIEQAETLYLSPASHWEIAIKMGNRYQNCTGQIQPA